MGQSGVGVGSGTDPNTEVGVPGANNGRESTGEENTPYNPPVEEGGTRGEGSE